MTTTQLPARPGHRFGPTTAVLLVTSALAVAALVTPAAASGPAEGDGTPPSTAPPTTAPPTTATTTTTTTTTTVPPAVPGSTVPGGANPPPATTAAPTTPPTTTATTVPPQPAAKHIRVGPEALGHIMATIRYLESRGNYLAPPNKGNASGAYQFIASTWANYGGYPHAYLAPPEIQDERAAIDVMKFLERWNYDVSMIPVLWYYPAASQNPALMDVVPVPSAGNVLTIREYQTRWLGIFSFLSGQPLPEVLTEEEKAARAGLPPAVPIDDGGGPAIAFPVLGPSRVAVPECDATEQSVDEADVALYASAGLCSEQAPGIVFGVQLQPVLAVVDGVVTAVHDDPGSDDPITVVVTDITGRQFVHSGFNDDSPGTDDGAAPAHLRLSALARIGNTVRAGQVIGFMGNSEPLPLGIRADVPTDATVRIDPDKVAPHIRISIVELDGTPVDAFGPLVDALFRQTCTVATGPWSMPPSGTGFRPVTIETTDNDREIDSEWVIGSSGIVVSTGWAAMVNPHEGCAYAPDEAHGPGAAGANDVPWSWLVPLDLPTWIWVELASAEATRTSPGLLLRG